MRIISKSHDYYDSVQRSSFSREPLFVRDYKEEKFEFKDHFPIPWGLVRTNAHIYMIGFCGKLYPLLIFYKSYNLETYKYCCYEYDDAKEFFEKFYSRRDLAVARDRYYPVIQRFFEEAKLVSPASFNFKAPIFVATYRTYGGEIKWNATLSQYEFYRVLPPYQAFQELEMYLCNLATPMKEIPKISDEILCEAKGFDKYSFRKAPKRA